MPPDYVLEAYALGPYGYGLVFVLGLLFGSFANVCIYRWPPTDEHPEGRSVVKPGSHCFACGKPVRWHDNIPVLSYLWLRGQCRDCKVEFSARYLFVEALTGMLFVAVWHYVMGLGFMDDTMAERLTRWGIYASFVFVLVVIAFIDLDYKLILNKVTYPAIPIFYGLGLLLAENHWYRGLIGIAVGYGIIRGISDLYYLLTKRVGLGYGDGKLLAIVGAVGGWEAVLTSLFMGSLLGSVIGILYLGITGKREAAPGEESGEDGDDEEVKLRHAALPFGPFLAGGAVIHLFLHPWLTISFAG